MASNETGKHFNFVEIGTSDFDTLIQQCNQDGSVCGLSIDPLQMYLDKLPEVSGCKKLAVAVSDRDGDIYIHYIPLQTIATLQLPSWIRGCNRVGANHVLASKVLAQRGLNPDEYIVREKVRVVSFSTLVAEENIESIDVLKIDTEGHDPIILKSYLEACIAKPSLFAHTIIFESNETTSAEVVTKIIDDFAKHRYSLLHRAHDTILVRL